MRFCRRFAHPIDALKDDAPLVHDDLGDNVAAHLEVRIGEPDEALDASPNRETLRLKMQRGGCGAMETRGHLASYDPKFDHLTLYATSQTPHLLRSDLAYMLGRSDGSIDVVAPDVGGGFGPKAYPYPEDTVIAWAAIRMKGSVKWIEDRIEHIQSTVQEREQHHEVEIGFDEEGRLLALKDRSVCDIGAYLPWSIVVPLLSVTCIPGPYKLRNFSAAMDVAYTHRVPVAPVRGAGRIQSVFIMERALDHIADRLGKDPAEVRHENYVQPDEFPYEVGLRARDGSMMTYDSGDYPRLLEMAKEASGYEEFRKGNRPPGEENDPESGIYVGMGMSCNIEGTGVRSLRRSGDPHRAIRPDHPRHRRRVPGTGTRNRSGPGLGGRIERIAGRRHGRDGRYAGHPVRLWRLCQPDSRHGDQFGRCGRQFAPGEDPPERGRAPGGFGGRPGHGGGAGLRRGDARPLGDLR